MYEILICSDSSKFYSEIIKEFEKRLGKNLKINYLRPSKSQDSKIAVKEDTIQIKNNLEKRKGFKILLSIFGEIFTSEDFSQFLENKILEHSNIIFVLGGSFGVDEKELENFINYKISLSKMTFPHSLALAILLEQIYRAESIKLGKKYHK